MTTVTISSDVEGARRATGHAGAPTERALTVMLLDGGDLDPAIVGGKAAPLARAHAAGHRVPQGLVVTSDAAERGIDALRGEIDAKLGALGDGPFAVRSSAVVEDGATRSFAGQLETVLGVPRADVAEAIERCWQSARALRAVRYATGDVGRVAVIVQAMVKADAAGVAFSADPRTGQRGVVLVEAVRGLGERLVSGEADPEAWRIESESCARARAGEATVLDDAKAREVAKLARDMEALFGRPQDIEWAFEGDTLYLLQSRPITALPAAPVPIPVEVPEGDWGRDDHHGVLSPLGWAWFQPYPKAMAEQMREIGMPIAAMVPRLIGGQLYMRMVMEGGGGDIVPPRWVLWLVTRLLPSMRRANKKAKELLDRETYMALLEDWEREGRDRFARELEALDVVDPSTLSDDALLARIGEALAYSARGLTLHAGLHGPGLFGVGKLYLFVNDHLGWSTDQVFTLVSGSSSATTELHRQIEAIVRAHADELQSAKETPRTWAALHAHCPRLGAALAAWLVQNRLRMLHYDPKHHTIGERPEIPLAVLDALVQAERDPTPDALAPKPEDELMREAETKLGAEQLAELRRLVGLARRGYALREANGVDTVSRPAGLLRHFVLELGRRIEPRIGAKEHAVYLAPEEHAPALRGEIADLAARIERRRGEESWALANRGPRLYGKAQPPPPHDAFPDGLGRVIRIFAWMETIEPSSAPAPSTTDGGLAGTGVGSRVVTARARVLRGPDELSTVRHGEIVVCRITSPEWSIGLGRVAAIVTDEGGLLSHPAIIAREYGIPAVLGTELATRRITTGDLLRVDPIAGTVSLLGTGST